DYAESVDRDSKIDSLNSFYGKIDYYVSFKKDVHPLKAATNNIYTGKLYVVDRLDIPYKIETIDTYVTHEFDVKHY
ncbi:MAG TPA: hypothetical protein VNW06_01280, partial [Cytophagaceae bacterium]|nr:hypothetical protein [Cytophagaceae bacterium]